MKIFTIGYGNRKFEEFVELLKRFGIELVADVRSFPTSKWPEFMKENLQKSLPAQGIGYVHVHELGGYRREGYEAHMRTGEFERGLKKVMRLARKPTVIMCVESSPSACHRRFITRKLHELGWEIVHIVGKGKQKIRAT